MKRSVLVGATLICCAIGVSRSQEQKKPEYGWRVGASMPFHVVDWVTGPTGKPGGGCPSVMTSNVRGRSVIIWAKNGDGEVYTLAKEIDAKLPGDKKKMGFLVRFADLRPAELRNEAEKYNLKRFHVALPRDSEKVLFDTADISGKATTMVFFLDHKEIKSVWRMPKGELDKERIQLIVKEADKFLAD